MKNVNAVNTLISTQRNLISEGKIQEARNLNTVIDNVATFIPDLIGGSNPICGLAVGMTVPNRGGCNDASGNHCTSRHECKLKLPIG